MSKSYFKYRPIYLDKNGELELETTLHVLEPIIKSYYYLPTIKQLNDPTEGTFDNQISNDGFLFTQGIVGIGERNEITRSITELAKHLSHSTQNSGVFSLSKIPTDELMWSYYSNSYNGLVIEYDVSLLTRFTSEQHQHRFDVLYEINPPTLHLKKLQDNSQDAIKAMLGHKSPRWGHEEEHRIILDNLNGPIPHDYRAVKSITFGLHVKESIRKKIHEKTKHKVKNYYEIKVVPNSYKLKRNLISEFIGNTPKGSYQEIEFDDQLTNIDNELKKNLKEKISIEIENDPHFKTLYGLDRSSNDKSKILLHYETKHDMPFLAWSNKYTKVYYPL